MYGFFISLTRDDHNIFQKNSYVLNITILMILIRSEKEN